MWALETTARSLPQLIEDPSVQVNGIAVVEDLSGGSFSMLMQARAQDPDQLGLKWMQACPRTVRLDPSAAR